MAKVVIIGRNYTSRLGMIRAIGSAEHEVYVICTNKSTKSGIDKKSRFVQGYYSAHEPNREELIQTLFSLRKQLTGSIILIPIDDYAASTIDENINRLKGLFLFPNINMQPGAINRLMDKEYQKTLAQKAGMNVAEGWTIEIKNKQYTIPKNVKYPCFPKPQVSFMGNKGCMKKCATEDELRIVLDKVAAVRDCPILIEEFIEIKNEYAALGFCDNREVVIPAVIHLLDQGHGGHRGVTKIGKLIPKLHFQSFFDKFEGFIGSLTLQGLFDVDMYEGGNGKIYFNELNLRFGASGYAITHQGINLPEMMVQSLLGEEIMVNPKERMDQMTGTFVNEKVNFEDYLAGLYGWNEYKRINKMADFTFLEDKNDPEPYRLFKRKAKRLSILWKMRRFVRKMIKHH